MRTKHAWVLLIVTALAPGGSSIVRADGGGARAAAPAVERPVRLVSAARDRQLHRLLPAVSDRRMQQVLDDPALILYTHTVMPRAYQHWSGQLQGVHSPSYNISAVSGEPFGNGNLEFPWSAPAGTHRTDTVTTFRFLWLPRDDRGHFWPVVWYRKRLRGDSTTGYAWTFPVGAIVGEVLCIRSPEGHDCTFEMRTRTRGLASWEADVFRPFPTAADLVRTVKQLRPDWAQRPELAQLVHHLERPLELPQRTLGDKQPFSEVFRETMGVDSLPPAGDDALVAELLASTPFQSTAGKVWRADRTGVFTCAPTTAARFHIVPARYDAGFIEVDDVSCMRCHETVNQPVARFDPSRDWYGRIRGSDGVFSFHPFAPTSISYNGFGVPIRMRRELTASGALARYASKRHPSSVYRQIRDLVQ